MRKNLENNIIFSPPQVAQQTIELVNQRRANSGKGVYTGIRSLDADLIPMIEGDLTIVLGRPSHYKTGLMLFMGNNESSKIVNLNLDDEIVVYITWEITVEEAGLMDICSRAGIPTQMVVRGTIDDGQFMLLQKSAIDRSTSPFWLIGHSSLNRKERPGLTMSDVTMALHEIEDKHKKKIRLVILDYLQQIEAESGFDRRAQVSSVVSDCKNLAFGLSTRVMLGCQARREVDNRPFKLPLMGDGGESSNIEHTADKIISVWMPKVTERDDFTLPFLPGYSVNDETLVIGLAKQRYHIAQRKYVCEVNHTTKRIYGIDESPKYATKGGLNVFDGQVSSNGMSSGKERE